MSSVDADLDVDVDVLVARVAVGLGINEDAVRSWLDGKDQKMTRAIRRARTRAQLWDNYQRALAAIRAGEL